VILSSHRCFSFSFSAYYHPITRRTRSRPASLLPFCIVNAENAHCDTQSLHKMRLASLSPLYSAYCGIANFLLYSRRASANTVRLSII
jgi:hypothetical protein